MAKGVPSAAERTNPSTVENKFAIKLLGTPTVHALGPKDCTVVGAGGSASYDKTLALGDAVGSAMGRSVSGCPGYVSNGDEDGECDPCAKSEGEGVHGQVGPGDSRDGAGSVSQLCEEGVIVGGPEAGDGDWPSVGRYVTNRAAEGSSVGKLLGEELGETVGLSTVGRRLGSTDGTADGMIVG